MQNVIADLCEKLDGNVEQVTHAMGLDPRIGGQFLKAGLGFGGFCFPKDIQAFIQLSSSVGVDFEILKAAERVNKARIDRFLQKVKQATLGGARQTNCGAGAGVQANTDDIRFSPAIASDSEIDRRRRAGARERPGSKWKKQKVYCRE